MRALLLSVFSAFLLTLSAASAGQLWTATGSTGTIDPAVISIATIGNSTVGYSSSSSSTTPITVRYNVTLDDTTGPTWSTLEILCNNANVTNGVFATLYSVNRTNGTVTLIASVGSTASASTQANTGGIGAVTFDFTNNYYVVKATLTRASSTAFPTLNGVRLY
jgi:hypothetical protein